MYKDQVNNNSTGNAEITTDKNSSVSKILLFIDRRISGFRQYYFNNETYSERENYISDILVLYFNSWLNEEMQGFQLFYFGKNSAQPSSTKEMDIGVRFLSTQKPSPTILEFEAKRLSNSSNNTEYVYGEKGGIERLKRKQHAGHLSICGMFGYVQSRTSNEWTTNINTWITNKFRDDKDNTINWTNGETLLELDSSIHKWKSINTRIGSSDLTIYHYFIDLTN